MLELPQVHGPKEMIRRTIDAAKELEPLLEAWDGQADPPATMCAWARGFMAGWGIVVPDQRTE